MANELEQRARQLLSARLEAAGQQPIAGDVFYGREHPAMTVAIRTLAAALQQAQQPGAQAVAYGYFAKGSGNLVIVEEKFSFLPHVFPLYTAPPPLPEGVSEEDVKAAMRAYYFAPGEARHRDSLRAALESYRARLAAKGGIVKA